MQLERELKRLVRQIRPGLIGATSNANVNLALVIEELKANPKLTADVSHALREHLLTRDYVTALTETGLTLEDGVFGEIYKRLEYKILPKELDSSDILAFLSRVFDSQSDASWLENIDRERFAELLALLLPDPESMLEVLSTQVFMALEILSLRLGGLGHDPLVSHRLKTRREFQMAFMDVARHVHDLLDAKGPEALPEINRALERCAGAAQWIRSRRGVEGISLALTYRLVKIQQVVHRMKLMVELIESILGEWKSEPARRLFFEIILAEIRRFELRRFLGQNVELLAFQITEHTGKTGEHYITRSRAEWQAMLSSAALGGAIVALLAILKTVVAKLHLPTGPEWLAFGSIYAIGFLVIHSLGGTLATKQPAMTASTLAASLDEAKNSQQAIENLSEIIVRTIRSQMGALLGNFLVACPVAIAICYPLTWLGHPLMDGEKAMGTMMSFHMFKSLSLWYASVAGICLFLAGLMAGFADNWFVFNNVGRRLKQSELLRKMVGAHNLDRAIHVIDHNLGIWVGNVSLGFMLALAPVLGVIFGLPLDVRHITFSSATYGAALASVDFQVTVGFAVWIAASVFLFGIFNLAVSFTLSLILAVKSRRIRFNQTPQLLKLLGRRFRDRPFDFLIPLRDPP